MSDPIYEAQAYEIAKMARSISALESENARLRELIREAIYAKDDADWASIVSAAIGLGVRCEDGDEEADV